MHGGGIRRRAVAAEMTAALANMLEAALAAGLVPAPGGTRRGGSRRPAMMRGEQKITSGHLDRTAVIYLRQSTLMQVREHGESTARQYGLAGEAARLGWAPGRIEVIDCDLGLSGRTATHREGFRDLLGRVCAGEAGAVFGLEISRLARSNADLSRLLEVARLTDTLVIDADGVYDLADINDRLLLGLKGQMSEAELHLLHTRLDGARLAAAARGDLRLPLPAGYVYDDAGQVVKDPDEEVAAAVSDMFAAFTATGSAYGVVTAFAARRFPGGRAGERTWGRLTYSRVVAPAAQPGLRRRLRVRPPPHPPAGRCRRRRAVPHPRRGPRPVAGADPRSPRGIHHLGALPGDRGQDGRQPDQRAGHGRRARAARYARASSTAAAAGTWASATTTTAAPTTPAGPAPTSRPPRAASTSAPPPSTHAVTGALLAAIDPAELTLAIAAAGEVTARRQRAARAAELAAERARYQADRAERAFSACEPENRLVARTLETRWEARLAELADTEAALAAQLCEQAPLPEPGQLAETAARLPGLWHAPTTTDKDRKRLLRTLLGSITLMPAADPAHLRIGLRWNSGATGELLTERYQ